MRRRIFAVVALALAMFGSTATSVQTASAAPAYYWNFVDDHGRCLTEYSSGAIRLDSCSGGTAQQWYWINSSWNTDWRMMKNRWTGDCLVAPDRSTEDVYAGSCEDWTSRHWSVAAQEKVHIWSGKYGNVLAYDDMNHVYLEPSDAVLYWFWKVQVDA